MRHGDLTVHELAKVRGHLPFFYALTANRLITEIASKKEDLQFGEQKKRRSWDMSLGNLVDTDFSELKNLHEKFSSSNMQ